MPKNFASGDQCHIHCDLTFAERDRFKRACSVTGVTMKDVMKHVITTFCEEVEAVHGVQGGKSLAPVRRGKRSA